MTPLEQLAKKFLETEEAQTAANLLHCCNAEGVHSLGEHLGDYFSRKFPTSLSILEPYALCTYHAGNHIKSYDINMNALNLKGLTEEESFRISFNAHFCIDEVMDRYNYYNEELVGKLTELPKDPNCNVSFSITSCKRYDLFEQTVNSFINTCEDVEDIGYWLCVDDNSSEEDREKMKKNFPFFDFYWKGKEEKGHPQSMNIIRSKIRSPYLFHMEDDWKIYVRRPYIKDCLEVLGESEMYGQCLVVNQPQG